jgi:hypothetical protein
MITTSSKNECFLRVNEICEEQILECSKYDVNQNVHPFKNFLRALRLNIRLFFETDKWEPTVTLKVGDSHYTLKMDDIESRWRKP